jgi:hypothetical protein
LFDEIKSCFAGKWLPPFADRMVVQIRVCGPL